MLTLAPTSHHNLGTVPATIPHPVLHEGPAWPVTTLVPRGALALHLHDSSAVGVAINGSRKGVTFMAGLPIAMTTSLIDQLADLQRQLRRVLAADGELCETDLSILEEVMEAKHIAMEVDEARLDAVSVLNTGRLGPARLRRHRELSQLQEWERDHFAASYLTEGAAT